MNTHNPHGQKIVGLTGIGSDGSDGQLTNAGQRQSDGGLEQRVGELERQVAELSAKNAELIRANEKLAGTHREMRTLLDHVPDLIYFKDAQSRFVNLNRALAKYLGAAEPELVIGKTDFDFNVPERAKEFYEDEQRIMKTEEALVNKVEKQALPNGEIAWTSTTKVPLRDEKGKIVGLAGISRDITAQIKAEEALRQSRDELEKQVAERTAELSKEQLLLRTLIDNLPDGIYAKDTAGRKTMANPADLKNLRCKTEAEAIGKSDFDLYPKDIAEKFWADDQKVLSGQPVIDREEYLFDEAGRKRWLLTSKLPLRDPDGKIVGLIGTGRDITTLKEAEEALAQERLLLRTLIDNLPDVIFAKDFQSRFILTNMACAQQLGADDPEKVLGKSDADFVKPELAAQYRADEVALMQSGQTIHQEERTQHKILGEMRWSLTTKLPLRDAVGRVVGLMGIARDITKIKKAEEALAQERILLRAIIDNLPDCIYAKDTAGRKTLANPADLKNLRCKTEAEAIGKNDFDLFPKEIAEKFWTDDLKVIGGEPIINREEYFFDEASQKRWLLTSKLPLRDQQGKILGLVGIGRDVTVQKQAEESLRESEERLRQFATQLERSNRELQDFAYVASHDLQEPLRKIVVFGERLKEANIGKFGPDSVDYLDRMQKATGRMQTLINDLLTFSRVTTKAQPFTSVDLAEVAAGVVEDLEGRIELVKGRVEIGALPVIEAEPLQMRQLLQNLIGNALKFRRPEEPPVVKVEAQIIPDPTTPDKKLCRLTVSDNCIGFDEKYVDRIFNVFQRLHTRNEYEGTGMGLAIVRKIALYHDGDITAKSKPGAGSTFILTIPATHPQKAPVKTANVISPPS